VLTFGYPLNPTVTPDSGHPPVVMWPEIVYVAAPARVKPTELLMTLFTKTLTYPDCVRLGTVTVIEVPSAAQLETDDGRTVPLKYTTLPLSGGPNPVPEIVTDCPTVKMVGAKLATNGETVKLEFRFTPGATTVIVTVPAEIDAGTVATILVSVHVLIAPAV